MQHSEWTAAPPGLPGAEFQFTLDWPAAIRASRPRTASLTVQPPSTASDSAFLTARLEFTGLAAHPARNAKNNGFNPYFLYNTPMPSRQWCKLIKAGILLVGLALLTVSTWPLPAERMEWTANPTGSSPGEFTFALAWPVSIRASEPGMAHLTIKPPPGQPANTMIEARLEFAGLVIAPAGIMAQPVGMAETLEFRWKLEPATAGVHFGTLWIYTSPLVSDSSEQRVALVARPLQVRAIFLGPVPVVWLRWVGIVLIALAAVLFIRQTRR